MTIQYWLTLKNLLVVHWLDSDLFNRCQIHGAMFEATLFAPIAIILSANLIIYCLVIRNLYKSRKAKKSLRSLRSPRAQRKIALVRSMTFATLLGLTWISGLFMFDKGSLPLQYIFTISTTLQGFTIFLLQCLANPDVRKRWLIFLRRPTARTQSELSASDRRKSGDVPSGNFFKTTGIDSFKTTGIEMQDLEAWSIDNLLGVWRIFSRKPWMLTINLNFASIQSSNLDFTRTTVIIFFLQATLVFSNSDRCGKIAQSSILWLAIALQFFNSLASCIL